MGCVLLHPTPSPNFERPDLAITLTTSLCQSSIATIMVGRMSHEAFLIRLSSKSISKIECQMSEPLTCSKLPYLPPIHPSTNSLDPRAIHKDPRYPPSHPQPRNLTRHKHLPSVENTYSGMFSFRLHMPSHSHAKRQGLPRPLRSGAGNG